MSSSQWYSNGHCQDIQTNIDVCKDWAPVMTLQGIAPVSAGVVLYAESQ